MPKSKYEVITNEFGNEIIKKTNLDGTVWWIPTDPANSDYQQYLASLNEADEL